MYDPIEKVLRVSGEDGGSEAFGYRMAQDPDTADQLIRAWSEERGRSVERLLVLNRARGLLARIDAAGGLSARSARELRRVLAAIDQVTREEAEVEA